MSFDNWVKCTMAIRDTREVLLSVAKDEINTLHQGLMQNVIKAKYLSEGTVCTNCSTPNVVPCPYNNICRRKPSGCSYHDKASKMPRNCPKQLCNGLQTEIKKQHRFNNPSWKNTNATKWCIQSWEIAKCFMPPDGYTEMESPDVTDFNGIINVMINCKWFETVLDDDLGKKNNICSEAREVGRMLRHMPDFIIDDKTSMKFIGALHSLLDDPKHLRSDEKAIDTRMKLNTLKTGHLVIEMKDITGIKEDSMASANEQLKQSLTTYKEDLVGASAPEVDNCDDDDFECYPPEIVPRNDRSPTTWVSVPRPDSPCDRREDNNIEDDISVCYGTVHRNDRVTQYVLNMIDIDEVHELTESLRGHLKRALEQCIKHGLEKTSKSIRAFVNKAVDNFQHDVGASGDPLIMIRFIRKLLRDLQGCIREATVSATRPMFQISRVNQSMMNRLKEIRTMEEMRMIRREVQQLIGEETKE